MAEELELKPKRGVLLVKYAEAEARANAVRPTRPAWFDPYSEVFVETIGEEL